jgi:hypothetical protein
LFLYLCLLLVFQSVTNNLGSLVVLVLPNTCLAFTKLRRTYKLIYASFESFPSLCSRKVEIGLERRGEKFGMDKAV